MEKKNNIDLNTITIAEAKSLNIQGMDMFTVVRNPINQLQLKKNEEFAAELKTKTARKITSIKRSFGPKKLEDIKKGIVAEVEQYTTVKLDSTIINSFILWNEKSSNKGQIWIKPDMVDAFKQANPEVTVLDFDPKAVVGAVEPYFGGGLVKNVDRKSFNQMVTNIIA